MVHGLRARIAAVVGVVVVIAGALVFAFMRGEDEAAPQSSFCWGTLSADDVATLSPKPFKRYGSKEHGPKRSRSCWVYVDDRKYYEFSLEIRDVDEGMGVWQTADEVAAESSWRAPISGAPGWVNTTYAGVLLPVPCARSLGIPGSSYLQVHVMDDQEEAWRDGEVQKRMTDVLMKSAANLTRQLGCAETPYTSPPETPRLLTPRPVDPAKACGLPGFAPLTSPGTSFQEYVTSGDLRLWSCAIAPAGDELIVRHLTVTQDPTVIATSRRDGRSRADEALLTCEGIPTLLQLGRPFRSTTESESVTGALRTNAEIFAGFREAVSSQAYCA